MTRQDDGGKVRVSRARLRRLRGEAVRERLRSFARGLYLLGPSGPVRRDPGVRAVLDNPRRYASVDPAAPKPPVDVTGTIEGGGRRRSRGIAVSVNGRVVASGWTLVSGAREYFTVIVPPTALRAGRNRVEAVPLKAR